jgi:hypothetical protein
MNKQIFFSHIRADYWKEKNRSAFEAKQLARTLNHVLFNDCQQFIKELSSGLDVINARNRRIAPLELQQQDDFRGEKGLVIYVPSVFEMLILKVEEMRI